MTENVRGTVIGSMSRLYKVKYGYALIRLSDNECIHSGIETIHKWIMDDEIDIMNVRHEEISQIIVDYLNDRYCGNKVKYNYTILQIEENLDV